jgi:nucleoside-triphosphatase
MSVLLVTGRPGIGKTTVIRRVAERLADLRLAGFWTDEMRRAGAREGFRLCTFDGGECVIASVRRAGAPRVGRYGVDVAAIDAVAATALAPAADVQLHLVDEIGRMECLSAAFVAAMRALLAADRPLVATVALAGRGLIEEVKRRPGARLWHVTHANRDSLPAEIARAVRERLG